MKDNKGKELAVGDTVLIFTYTRAIVTGLLQLDGDDRAKTRG